MWNSFVVVIPVTPKVPSYDMRIHVRIPTYVSWFQTCQSPMSSTYSTCSYNMLNELLTTNLNKSFKLLPRMVTLFYFSSQYGQ